MFTPKEIKGLLICALLLVSSLLYIAYQVQTGDYVSRRAHRKQQTAPVPNSPAIPQRKVNTLIWAVR